MVSKHTPGPWSLTTWTAPDDYGWSIKIPNAPHRLEVSAWSAASESDAKLIVAAPDLAKALESLLYRFDYVGEDANDEEVIDAIAALKKAGY